MEAVCHLHDVEGEAFRLGTKEVLEHPHMALPPFNPISRVKERNYTGQNYDDTVDKFQQERQNMIWLENLKNSDWRKSSIHPNLDPMSAGMYLLNRLAQDYLHPRRMIKFEFDYLKW